MIEPTPPATEPVYVLRLGPNEVYVRLDGGEEDSTERTSDEIRRYCAVIKQRYAEELGIAPGETQMSHECLEGGEEINSVLPTQGAADQHLPLPEGPDQPQPGPKP
jgi:hypothetical protein